MTKEETTKALRDWMISFKPAFLELMRARVTFHIQKTISGTTITLQCEREHGIIRCSFKSPHGSGVFLYDDGTKISSKVRWIEY